MAEGLREACGVFGISGDSEAANLTYLGLYALQHRGQESAGIVSSDGQTLRAEVGMGLVAEVFTEERLKYLSGSLAIGHNRYSTSGSSDLANAQPLLARTSRGTFALAHNGTLVNAKEIRNWLESEGAIFRSMMDTEIVVHLIARSRQEAFEDRVVEALGMVEGAYSLLLMTEGALIGVRDPHGFRPLVLGRRQGAYVLASESCALDLIDGELVREIEPGEMVVIDRAGIRTFRPFESSSPAPCIFEFVYFARPDSTVFGRNVYQVRRRLGERLAAESPAEADIVIPIPDSGVPAAMGYAHGAGLPFEMGLIRNHYVGRTFIEPEQAIRHFGVKIKLNAVRASLEGRRVVVVDDSIVRATTSRKIVHMIRQAGATEVHMRISSPPITGPCFYGIDTPRREELIASNHSVAEIEKFLEADSLAYLSLKGMLEAVDGPGLTKPEGHFCAACFTGDYPVPVPPQEDLSSLKDSAAASAGEPSSR